MWFSFMSPVIRAVHLIGTALLSVLVIAMAISYVKKKRVAQQLVIATGLIFILLILMNAPSFIYEHRSLQKQVEDIATLPPQAVVTSVDSGDWNDGEIVFTLPETKPPHEWLAAMWHLNSLTKIDLSHNVKTIKDKSGTVRIVPELGLSPDAANIWAGSPDAHDNSVVLTYDPVAKEYTYDADAPL